MRTPLIVGNWKMNKTVSETIRLITEIKSLLSGKQEVEIAVAPAYTSLHPAEIAAQGTPIKIAAQDVFYEESGPYTGMVSTAMLVDVGCTYVIVGHSDRRRLFGETDTIVNKKVLAALDSELKPILCVGETQEERSGGKTFDVIDAQLRAGVRGVRDHDVENLVVAYEPVWAIGTGEPASPGMIREVHRFLRERLEGIFRRDAVQKTHILYGGSVTPENIKDLMAQPDIDGALVGTASLDAKSFAQIVNFKE